MNGPVVIVGDTICDTTDAGNYPPGGPIFFSGAINNAGSTAYSLKLIAGNTSGTTTGSAITFGGVVGTPLSPINNLNFSSCGLINIGSNITVTGANPLTFQCPVKLTGTSTITTTDNRIQFESALDGNQALTLAAGWEPSTFGGAARRYAALGQSHFYQCGRHIYRGRHHCDWSQSFNVFMSCYFTGMNTIATTNNSIQFESTLDGNQALTLAAGPSGTITFGGAVLAGMQALANLIFTSAADIYIGADITVTGAHPLTFSCPVILTGTNTITSTGNNIQFESTLDGNQVTLAAGPSGTIAFDGAVGGTNPLAECHLCQCCRHIYRGRHHCDRGQSFTVSISCYVNGNEYDCHYQQ